MALAEDRGADPSVMRNLGIRRIGWLSCRGESQSHNFDIMFPYFMDKAHLNRLHDNNRSGGHLT